MCDYSLGNVPNRLANEGEQLRVHQFISGVKGLVSVADQTLQGDGKWWTKIKSWLWEEEVAPVAVCVPPGARLLMHDIPANLQQQFNVSAMESVTFTQLHAEAFLHRDAVRFSNGNEVLLQKFKPGQLLDVVSLSLPEDEPVALHTAEARISEMAYF